MSVLNQKTINKDITFKGVGLHSGLVASMTIKPAEPNSGIIFSRIDLKDDNKVIPNIFNVNSAVFCTTISNESGVSVSTIEHLMGALYGLGIDNVLIEIDNQEVPILDGSAKLFVEAISEAGIKSSEAPIKIIKIKKKIEFIDGNKTISIEPSKVSLDIDFELKYENDLIGTQRNLIKVFESDLRDVFNSRTFCLFEDIQKLREMGLAKGGNLDNALIEIDNQEVPILDGSAKLFVEAISEAGIKNSQAPIKIIKIKKKIEFVDGNKTISIEPSKISLDIDFELKYENDLIGTQRNLIKVFESDLRDVFNSRTFCLFEDIQKLKEMGLAKGGNLDNAIVVKDNKILNENGLRNEKEFVNHKILDCMGDLYLSGYKIIGKIICSQGGHKLTNQLLRKVFQNDENFSLIEITEKYLPSAFINKSHLKSIA